MKLSDYVVRFLIERGLEDIFLVAGGGIMHLLDSVGSNPGLKYYCNYHEQACAICAEAYSRVTHGTGACLVTTGPGAANALSGVAGAWVDSIPMLVISGQVRSDLIADYCYVRQTGPQEGNIIHMARYVTKYAKTILDPQGIRAELDHALATATTGRPGPVWLEIPLDVQASEIDEARLASHSPSSDHQPPQDQPSLAEEVRRVIEAVRTKRRPLWVFGNGIHLSNSEELLSRLVELMPFPIVLPHTAKDLIAEDHPRYVGVFGSAGQRRANFAIQNSDCIIALAVGLNVSKTGFNYKGFAPGAQKIVVDIDDGQLLHQPMKADVVVKADIHAFLTELIDQVTSEHIGFEPSPKWIEACSVWKQRYPIIVDDYFRDTDHVNSYVFMDRLSDVLQPSDVVVVGNGLDAASYWQAFKVKMGQRTLINGNWGSMGWDLPAAIGACIGTKRSTICVTGDGSLQWNVQELLTIRHNNLPVKVFVFNNHGYSNIRATQAAFFGRFVGADVDSGVGNPDFRHLAAAYGFSHAAIRNNAEILQGVGSVLARPGPVLCEVNISPEQGITPKASAFRREDGTIESRPLEDMAPFLPRQEVWDNMHLFDDER